MTERETGGGERLVAFLRGMNLGGRRIRNDALASHFEAAGLDGVAVYQASGNVVFRDPGDPRAVLERRVEEHLRDSLGYPVDMFIRTLPALEEIVAAADLAAAREAGFKVHVILLREAPDREVATALGAMETEDDRFVVRGREIYWLRRGRLSDSTIPASDPGRLTGGATSTMRTLGTLERIVRKFG